MNIHDKNARGRWTLTYHMRWGATFTRFFSTRRQADAALLRDGTSPDVLSTTIAEVQP